MVVGSTSHLVLVSDRQELDLIGIMFISVVSSNHWLFGLLPAFTGDIRTCQEIPALAQMWLVPSLARSRVSCHFASRDSIQFYLN